VWFGRYILNVSEELTGRVLRNDARYIYRITQGHIPKDYYLYTNVLLMCVFMLVNLKSIHSIVKHFFISYVREIKLLYLSEQSLDHIITIIFVLICCTIHILLFCTMTNKCTIITQIITFLHVSTLSCHPQTACNQYLAKSHK
jgi:hypothetical protein